VKPCETSSSEFVVLGKVTRPHGLDGVLRVRSWAESEESFTKTGRLILETTHGERNEFEVVSARPHKRVVLLELSGIRSIEEADYFRDAQVLARKDPADQDNDEFFWDEIIGLEVYLDTGRFLGKVREILPTGGTDVYIVRAGGKEFMIPAAKEIVQEIDLTSNRIVIAEIEGLLELN
jgi:16S rRNA processing protein RimM